MPDIIPDWAAFYDSYKRYAEWERNPAYGTSSPVVLKDLNELLKPCIKQKVQNLRPETGDTRQCGLVENQATARLIPTRWLFLTTQAEFEEWIAREVGRCWSDNTQKLQLDSQIAQEVKETTERLGIKYRGVSNAPSDKLYYQWRIWMDAGMRDMFSPDRTILAEYLGRYANSIEVEVLEGVVHERLQEYAPKMPSSKLQWIKYLGGVAVSVSSDLSKKQVPWESQQVPINGFLSQKQEAAGVLAEFEAWTNSRTEIPVLLSDLPPKLQTCITKLADHYLKHFDLSVLNHQALYLEICQHLTLTKFATSHENRLKGTNSKREARDSNIYDLDEPAQRVRSFYYWLDDLLEKVAIRQFSTFRKETELDTARQPGETESRVHSIADTTPTDVYGRAISDENGGCPNQSMRKEMRIFSREWIAQAKDDKNREKRARKWLAFRVFMNTPTASNRERRLRLTVRGVQGIDHDQKYIDAIKQVGKAFYTWRQGRFDGESGR